ncbi:MAG: acylneuraminate cytidylyltransferase family protein [Chryseolinea sp.]
MKRILAVVPARGGSKGIKLKNLREVAGKTLVGWAGTTLKQISMVDRKIISTDHHEISMEAERNGLSVPFMRPEDLSGDFISDLQVLHHALTASEKFFNETFDVVVMLQPTSPARTVTHIEEVITKLVDDDLDAVWTVSPTDLKYHPLKQLSIGEDGLMDFYLEGGKAVIARQQLKPVYHRNGICYAFTRDCLLKQETIKGKRTGAVVIEGRIPNIDTVEDLAFAEEVISKMELS